MKMLKVLLAMLCIFVIACQEDDTSFQVGALDLQIEPTGFLAEATPSPFDSLLGVFGKITTAWSIIVQNFKCSRSTEIKQRLIGKGFSSFDSSAQIQISKGIQEIYMARYIEQIAKRVKVPQGRQKDLTDVLEGIMFMDKNVWNAYDTLFSIDAGGNVKFVSILSCNNEAKKTFDVLYSDVTATFKLAPDVLVVHKKLVVLGGLWTDEKDENISVPKSLTQEDLNLVMDFFQIIAIKTFANQFGIALDFPKM